EQIVERPLLGGDRQPPDELPLISGESDLVDFETVVTDPAPPRQCDEAQRRWCPPQPPMHPPRAVMGDGQARWAQCLERRDPVRGREDRALAHPGRLRQTDEQTVEGELGEMVVPVVTQLKQRLHAPTIVGIGNPRQDPGRCLWTASDSSARACGRSSPWTAGPSFSRARL